MKKEKEYPGKVGELAESVREALKNNELIKWDNNNISWIALEIRRKKQLYYAE